MRLSFGQNKMYLMSSTTRNTSAHSIWPNFPKNRMKMKKIGLGMGRLSSNSPIISQNFPILFCVILDQLCPRFFNEIWAVVNIINNKIYIPENITENLMLTKIFAEF